MAIGVLTPAALVSLVRHDGGLTSGSAVRRLAASTRPQTFPPKEDVP